MKENNDMKNRLLKTQEISEYFGFGKTKMNELFQSGVLPVVKIGKDYVTSIDIINGWLKENLGREIFF